MSLDVLGPLPHVTEPLRPVGNEQFLDQVFGDGIHVLWPLDSSAQYLLVYPEGVVVEEGRESGQHLVYQNPQSPPVNSLVVTLALDDLWRQVFGRSAKRPCPDSKCVIYRISLPSVLTRDHRTHLSVSFFENPKSVIFRCPCPSSSRFSGFRSLYTMCLA